MVPGDVRRPQIHGEGVRPRERRGGGAREKVAARNRLRDDRNAGLYDDEDDAEWYRERYSALAADIKRLRATPVRPAGMVERPTGETVASKWAEAADDGERRQMLHEFGVTVEVFPEGHSRRWRPLVGGEDPDADIAASIDAMRARAAR